MKKTNQIIFALLAFLMMAGTVFAQETQTVTETVLENQLSLEDIQALNDGQAEVFIHNDRVTFVNGSCTADPVKNVDDAAGVVLSMIRLLGGDERVQFVPWRTLTDTTGNIYYVFSQMYAGTNVLGGAAKVITDADGKMIAFSSSIETDLPDAEASEGIMAEEAEKIVLSHAEEEGKTMSLLPDFTDKIILPMVLSIDINDDTEDSECRFVWVVYTDNPVSRLNSSADLPYLAHYVGMDGTYLYSLATIMPGDTAGSTGFDSEYVFEFMEPAEYTGYVDWSDGTEKEITVTLMRDKRTGMYYLGNIERKIVVANAYEFLYNNGTVRLLSSPDNLEWDQVGLMSFYNYCRVYDYYKEIGWIGGNGLSTPIMILNDLCDENYNQINNAAFIGNYLGWSLFGASQANDFSQCLDVIAHEFTHCVTGAVMTYNAYTNDFGAINEAISDIQGEICEQYMGDTDEDSLWVIGNHSLTSIRSMSDPHRYSQPEYSWDLYYIPPVKTATAVNDNGGVHSNSSLLNNVAYRLIVDGGMSLEEARAFWFAVDCTMVPGTDYEQLSEMMPFVLKSLGMEKYNTALQRALDATRLGITDMPDFFDNDRALVTMELPDNENFTDDNWTMLIYSLDVHGIADTAAQIIGQLISGDFSDLPQTVQELLTEEAKPKETPAEEDASFIDLVLSVLSVVTEGKEPEPTPEPTPDPREEKAYNELTEWLRQKFVDYFYSGMGSAGIDGRTIRMMTRPGRTIPVLLHMSFDGISEVPDQVVLAIYLNNRWYELPGMDSLFTASGESELAENEVPEDDPLMNKLTEDLIDTVMANLGKVRSLDDVLDLFTIEIKGGEVCEISATGLEEIVLPEKSDLSELVSEAEYVPGRMSRPKLSEPEEETK